MIGIYICRCTILHDAAITNHAPQYSSTGCLTILHERDAVGGCLLADVYLWRDKKGYLVALDLKEGYWPTDPHGRMIETGKIVAVRLSLFRELLD